MPVHTEDGVTTTRATGWQLADRTTWQLDALRTTTLAQMHQAADDLDFERAALLRDELVAIDAEVASRQG